MSGIVIFGATSAIAMETARLFAAEGEELCLVGRSPAKLEALRQDLSLRGARRVSVEQADLADCTAHEELLHRVEQELPGYDTVLVAYGSLGSQPACEERFAAAERELRTNFTSVVSLLTPLANRFAAERRGVIAVIGSVAGDRGRRSNYVYGAAKGGLAIFLQGLRNRLHSQGVRVVTIKPGFIDTPMTAGLPKGPLFASAGAAGRAIHRAIRRRRDVVYVPWFWRWIMAVITHVPEALFKRQKKI